MTPTTADGARTPGTTGPSLLPPAFPCHTQELPEPERLTSAVGDVAAHAHLLHQLGEHAVLLLRPLPALQGLAVLLVFLQTLEGAAAGLPRPNQSEAISGRSPACRRASRPQQGWRRYAGTALPCNNGLLPPPDQDRTARAPHDGNGHFRREKSSEKGTTARPSHDTQTSCRHLELQLPQAWSSAPLSSAASLAPHLEHQGP